MSYDYQFFLLTRPLGHLRECDESLVAMFDDWQRIYEILRQRFPTLQWQHDERGYRARDDATVGGRFEIVIDFDTAINARFDRQYGKFRARGSRHADQVEHIREIAAAVDFSAFDMQSGERIHLQSFDNRDKGVDR